MEKPPINDKDSMRIYTCAPVAFSGGSAFFSRDSGLLCRGLQTIGIDSCAVLPGEPTPEDCPDLIRTEYDNLESASWWKSLNIDGVVLYAWGRPKYHKVAAAIRKANITLVVNMDSNGLASPVVSWKKWLHAQWIFGGEGRDTQAWLRFFKFTLQRFFVGFCVTERLRGKHLRCGDIIACVSPISEKYIKRLCYFHGKESLANKVALIPHSVEPTLRYSGGPKREQIICIGRWDDQIQKRTWLLTAVLDELLTQNRNICVVIVGKTTSELDYWHQHLTLEKRNRITLTGIIGRQHIRQILDESMIFYSSSAYESFGIAAAEALCSGCSVVAARSITMPAFDWFVSEESGRLAKADHIAGHTNALSDELQAWKSGSRDPSKISKTWTERLHADHVAGKLLALMDSLKG